MFLLTDASVWVVVVSEAKLLNFLPVIGYFYLVQ